MSIAPPMQPHHDKNRHERRAEGKRQATIILTREQVLEQRLAEAYAAMERMQVYSNEVMRLAGGVIRENRILKSAIPRHRALVVLVSVAA